MRCINAGGAGMLLALSMAAASAWNPAAAAEPLGRFFLTPEQRVELERLRHAPPAPVTPPAPPPVVEADLPPPVTELSREEMLPPAPPPIVPPITVNGVVIRSNGESTAWVNGQNTLEGDFSRENIRVVRPRGESVRIITPEHLPDVTLKPGQTYDPGTNTIIDAAAQSP
ncbi:MAG: hypothetical protein NFCOHLIN_02839 [Gammaproteobacteria bacterium]|nr:hypothetical protein [Gammaproteobacteria bacterium]